MLKKEQYSACGLLEQFHIEYAAPCIQLGDSLEDFFQVKNIVPSLRGDDLLDFTNPVFSGTATLAELRLKLSVEINKLHDASCRFADHALDHGFSYIPDDGKNEARFISMKQGRLSADDSAALSCEILRILGTLYTEKGWTLQLHTGALRNTSTRLRMIAGPAGGYAAIGNRYDIESLVALLDDLEKRMGKLPGVILYTLNPADYAAFAVLSGSFSGDGEAGKIMPGPAWWYCDHIHGMKDCFENLATYSVLSLFPGMTTDSRNILSFVRHEYFRRVFCNYLAEKAAKTEFPDNVDLLGDLAEKVCYFNAETMIQ